MVKSRREMSPAERQAEALLRRRQQYCPHHRLSVSIVDPLYCQDCLLSSPGLLIVKMNERLNLLVNAMQKVGLEQCSTCFELGLRADTILLPASEPVEVDDGGAEEPPRRFCAGDAAVHAEQEQLTLTDDQLRWFGEHLEALSMPSWLLEEMRERIGYRSKDLP